MILIMSSCRGARLSTRPREKERGQCPGPSMMSYAECGIRRGGIFHGCRYSSICYRAQTQPTLPDSLYLGNFGIFKCNMNSFSGVSPLLLLLLPLATPAIPFWIPMHEAKMQDS